MAEKRMSFEERRIELLKRVKERVPQARSEKASRVDDQEVPLFLRRLRRLKDRSKNSRVAFG